MRVVLVGASGTVGQAAKMGLSRHEIIAAGRSSGDVTVDLTSEESIRAMYQKVGKVDAVVAALTSHGLAAASLGPDLKPTPDKIAVGTMHRLKGLEFKCVVIVDADADSVPLPNAVTDARIDEAQHDADVRRERCLVYVACTRARDELLVTWSGKPSKFLTT